MVKKIYKRSVTVMRRKLKKLAVKFSQGRMTFEDVLATWQSWKSYAERFHAWRTIQSMGKLYNSLFIFNMNEEGYNGILQGV